MIMFGANSGQLLNQLATENASKPPVGPHVARH